MENWREWSDTKTYMFVVGAILFVYFIVANAHTIFPVMDEDEFFVDKYWCMHNKNCPYKSVLWFKIKKSKYDFMKNKDWKFCSECFSDDEIEKMMILHHYNVRNYIEYLQINGATDEYIEGELMQYGE